MLNGNYQRNYIRSDRKFQSNFIEKFSGEKTHKKVPSF